MVVGICTADSHVGVVTHEVMKTLFPKKKIFENLSDLLF